MTATHIPPRPRRRSVRWARALRRRGGLVRSRDAAASLGFTVLGVVLLVLVVRWPNDVPWSFYGVLIVLAGLYLSTRWFLFTCLGFAVCLAYAGTMARGWSMLTLLALAALVLTMLVMTLLTRSRARLGLTANVGENMLVDLRERLLALGEIPALPGDWHAECSIRSAYGDKFSGDFAVTTLSAGARTLEVVLVDLSGKGREAGTRALLFSGAIGGLLGQVEPDRVLCGANSYLLRQGWLEGFASAVHVCVDLDSGEFTIGNAGHPVPAQFAAGSGRWSTLTSAGGPVLGIIPGAQFPRRTGTLGRGDALLLYTDGVVEGRGHDLESGVDRLLGSAERLLPAGFSGGAKGLAAQGRAGDSDDRAVVMIWRG